MFQSYPVSVNGNFVGGAMSAAGGFRFRAVHPQVDDLDGSLWPSLAALRAAVGQLFTTGRVGPVPAPRPAAVVPSGPAA